MPAKSGSTSRRRLRTTSEFRAEAVRLVADGGLSQAQAGRDLGISAKVLSSWVRVARERSLPGAMGDAERDELKRLRASGDRVDLLVATMMEERMAC